SPHGIATVSNAISPAKEGNTCALERSGLLSAGRLLQKTRKVTIQISAAIIDLMATMKRSLSILFAIILVLGTYAASPYLALRRIISAVHARNALALSDSVDFDRLRQSLTGQVIERNLQLTGRTARLGQIGSIFAVARPHSDRAVPIRCWQYPASKAQPSSPTRRTRADDRRHGHLLDNLSGLPAWLSDALCRLASGGSFAVRQLYSDDEEVLFR